MDFFPHGNGSALRKLLKHCLASFASHWVGSTSSPALSNPGATPHLVLKLDAPYLVPRPHAEKKSVKLSRTPRVVFKGISWQAWAKRLLIMMGVTPLLQFCSTHRRPADWSTMKVLAYELIGKSVFSVHLD